MTCDQLLYHIIPSDLMISAINNPIKTEILIYYAFLSQLPSRVLGKRADDKASFT